MADHGHTVRTTMHKMVETIVYKYSLVFAVFLKMISSSR